jgi:hypothetical protein
MLKSLEKRVRNTAICFWLNNLVIVLIWIFGFANFQNFYQTPLRICK